MRKTILACLMAVLMVCIARAKDNEPDRGDRKAQERVQSLLPITSGGQGGLTCISAEKVDGGIEAICELIYPDIQGKPVAGQAKIFLPKIVFDDPKVKCPLLHVAGYETDRGMGEGRLKKGEIVSTPHAEAANPVVRAETLDVAILHRVRALPFVDDANVEILGGSAGGYMTLLLAAETFPLACCAPDVPPVNMGYNMAYFSHNKALAAAKQDGVDHLNMPVLNVVCPLQEQAAAFYGEDYGSDAWFQASPIARLDEITCPTLIVCSTADILVPIDQFGEKWAGRYDPAKFPAGFEMRMDPLSTHATVSKTLLAILPPERVEVFEVKVPDTAAHLGWDGKADGDSLGMEMPFAKDKTFTLAVLDEGAPEPQCAHTKHAVGAGKDEFLKHYRGVPIPPNQITPAKLRRLMLRYLHKEAHPAMVRVPNATEPFVANRMDFPELEKADVIRGLRTFSSDPARAEKLSEVYRGLPPELKPLGEELDLKSL